MNIKQIKRAAGALIAALIFLLLINFPTAADELKNNSATAVVGVNALNVRSGPGTNYGVVGALYYGNSVRMLGRNYDSTWVKIEYGYGSVGWVSANLIYAQSAIGYLPVVDQTPSPSQTGQVSATTALNIRSGPGVGFAVIGSLFPGHPATVLDQDGSASWLFVRLEDGRQGWISGVYTKPYVRTAAPSTPSPQPTAPQNQQQFATINTGALNLRYGPGLDYYPILIIHRGESVALLHYNQDYSWVKVNYKGTIGWVKASLLSNFPKHQPQQPPAKPTCQFSVVPGTSFPPETAATAEAHGLPRARVATGAQNIRSGPGPEFEVVNTLNNGAIVYIVRRHANTNWVLVWLEPGNEGWMNACYLQAEVGLNSLPIN